MRAHVLCVTLLAIAAGPAPALAQPVDSTAAGKIGVARRLYDEGVEAVGQGRWSLAHDRFKASFDLSPRVLTLFNLAGAQVQTSRFVEASESYRRFLRETADGRYGDLRAEATKALEDLEKQIAHVAIEISNLDGADVVIVDDAPFPQTALREPFPVNPGPHRIEIRRNGGPIAQRTITLDPGVAEKVRIDVPVRSPDLQVRSVDAAGEPTLTGTSPSPSPSRRDGDNDRSVFASPWFWGAVVLVAAGGATGVYLLTRPDDNTLVVR